MINNVPEPQRRTRLSSEERRRQLVAIGLGKFTERPALELALDEISREAGISRGLLFHYFPTKSAYLRAVVEAACRRVVRNVTPDPELGTDQALTQLIERFLAQVERRRESYVALVYGRGLDVEVDTAATLRAALTDLVAATGHPARRMVVHAWLAYLEDVALAWSAGETGFGATTGQVAEHCRAALDALNAAQRTL